MRPQDFWELRVHCLEKGKILHYKALWDAKSIEREIYFLKTNPAIREHPWPIAVRWRRSSCPF